MEQFDLGPFPIECQKCGKEIPIMLSDFKVCNILKCEKCDQEHHVTDGIFKEYQISIRDLKKTLSDVQKKINKAFK